MTLNLYATLADLKARLGLTDTADDAILGALLSAVSRQIETWTGRQFWAVVDTLEFGPDWDPAGGLAPWDARVAGSTLQVDDLLSVTSLTTDIDGDRVYETTWSATDYELEPVNADRQSPPRPFTRVRVRPLGRYWFPSDPRGTRIFGTWGYYDVLTTSTATLAEALDTSETGVDVTNGTAFQAGQVIEIDSERMEIASIATNTLTVERAVNGTTAATHTLGAAIRVATFPIVGEACLLQAQRAYFAKNTPQGVAGGTSLGVEMRQQFSAGLHPFVKDMLAPFRVPRAG